MPLCGMTERGASPACGRGAAAGGGEGKNREGSLRKSINIQTPPLPAPQNALPRHGAKWAEKIGNKEKKAKTKNL